MDFKNAMSRTISIQPRVYTRVVVNCLSLLLFVCSLSAPAAATATSQSSGSECPDACAAVWLTTFHIAASIATSAGVCLFTACGDHDKSIRGAIHHTDADVRYCSDAYVAQATELGLTMSMTVGNVYENAHAESLNKTFKRQEINVNEYPHKQGAAESLFRFKRIYNEERPHSSLGNLTPIRFRKNFEAKNI